jgi:hypothetical protein
LKHLGGGLLSLRCSAANAADALLAARWVAAWSTSDVAGFAAGGWVVEIAVRDASKAANVSVTLQPGAVQASSGPAQVLPVTASCLYAPPISWTLAPGGRWLTFALAAGGQAAAVPAISPADAVLRAAAAGVALNTQMLIADSSLTLFISQSASAGVESTAGIITGFRPAEFASSALSSAALAAQQSRPEAPAYAFDLLVLSLQVRIALIGLRHVKSDSAQLASPLVCPCRPPDDYARHRESRSQHLLLEWPGAVAWHRRQPNAPVWCEHPGRLHNRRRRPAAAAASKRDVLPGEGS